MTVLTSIASSLVTQWNVLVHVYLQMSQSVSSYRQILWTGVIPFSLTSVTLSWGLCLAVM